VHLWCAHGDERPSDSVIASDHRERGNLTVVVVKDCEIASASPRNDPGDFQDNDPEGYSRQ
jgi:hypothetical protein